MFFYLLSNMFTLLGFTNGDAHTTGYKDYRGA